MFTFQRALVVTERAELDEMVAFFVLLYERGVLIEAEMQGEMGRKKLSPRMVFQCEIAK